MKTKHKKTKPARIESALHLHLMSRTAKPSFFMETGCV